MKKIVMAIIIVVIVQTIALVTYHTKQLDQPIIVGQIYSEAEKAYFITYIDNKQNPRAVTYIDIGDAYIFQKQSHVTFHEDGREMVYPSVENNFYGVYTASIYLAELEEIPATVEQVLIYFSDRSALAVSLNREPVLERQPSVFQATYASSSSNGEGRKLYEILQNVTLTGVEIEGEATINSYRSSQMEPIVFPVQLKKGDTFSIDYQIEEATIFNETSFITFSYVDENGHSKELNEVVYKPFSVSKKWLTDYMKEL